jgi:uncharacterized protein (DUF427 family)
VPRAVFGDEILAQSDDTKVVEGNHYFPPESVRTELFLDSPTRTVCFWKGTASYLSLVTDDGQVPDIAWVYEDPSRLARKIVGHVAFGPRVRIEA